MTITGEGFPIGHHDVAHLTKTFFPKSSPTKSLILLIFILNNPLGGAPIYLALP